jgi:hypothetical protein
MLRADRSCVDLIAEREDRADAPDELSRDAWDEFLEKVKEGPDSERGEVVLFVEYLSLSFRRRPVETSSRRVRHCPPFGVSDMKRQSAMPRSGLLCSVKKQQVRKVGWLKTARRNQHLRRICFFIALMDFCYLPRGRQTLSFPTREAP